ncbi:hypothetical protein [Amycolatopsis balhimycina]|uniref:hypothetical protein n=1 Tax=Amycolatopsis balhimycina TaxID=208443 RepID=UPI001FDFF8E9|nr:hypothetical protein [Amycolatopsis balhimycina]
MVAADAVQAQLEYFAAALSPDQLADLDTIRVHGARSEEMGAIPNWYDGVTPPRVA